jgi:protein O-mannosyl-transferase
VHPLLQSVFVNTGIRRQLTICGCLTAGVALLLVAAYGNSLDTAFVFDDEPSIVENSSIRRLLPLGTVLFSEAEGGRTHDGRPLLNLSLAITYALSGLAPAGFRLGNLAIHLVNTLLFFDVVRRVLAAGAGIARSPGSWAAGMAAAVAVVWSLHPLHTNVITYAIQRAESLAALGVLAAFDASAVALMQASLPAAGLAVAAAILGGLCKETTASLLPVVLAFDWAFCRHRTGLRAIRGLLYPGLALNWLVIAAVMLTIGGREGSAGLGTMSSIDYLLTQCRGIWIYLGRLLWPHVLVLDYGDVPDTSLAATWPFVAATIGLAVAIMVGFVKRPTLFFLPVAAMLLLAPSSSIVPVATQVLAEHRMYLPSAFLLGGLVAGILFAARAPDTARGRTALAAAVIAVCVGIVCVEVVRIRHRNRDFATGETLWRQNVRDCPGNVRGVVNLAAALIRQGRLDEAEPLVRQALAARPTDDQSLINLGRIHAARGDNTDAVQAFTEALRAKPARVEARINRAIVMSRDGRFAEALTDLEAAITARPDLAKGWLARGVVLIRQGRPAAAMHDLETAIRLDPENPAGGANLAAARALLLRQPGMIPRDEGQR